MPSQMRHRLVIGLWGIAALAGGCGADEGAVLVVRAPDGPGAAARLEIVLANASGDAITDLDGQRVAPGAFDAEPVRYYRQRAAGGEVAAIAALDGFTLRIEPNLPEVPERAFVPFLVAYDAQDQVIGIGAVRGGDGLPMAIDVSTDARIEYVVDVVPIAATDGAEGIGAREGLAIACSAGSAKWPSGLAWRPDGDADAPQLRLLLPDRGADASATDASKREADLDCDGHAAPDQDCDDLRGAYNRGAAEACDGVDANCDGQRYVAEPCANDPTSCAGATDRGVQLCDDRSGEPVGACVADPACACAAGSPGCNRCALAFQTTAAIDHQAPCAPSVGKLRLEACTSDVPCTVEVIATSGPWRAFIAQTAESGFTLKLEEAVGPIYLEVKLGGTTEVAGVPDASVGAVYLAVTQGGQTRSLGVDLALREVATTSCPEISGTGTFEMVCSP